MNAKQANYANLEPGLDGKANRIRLLDFSSAPMRAFHVSWFAFFLSFLHGSESRRSWRWCETT